MKHKIVYWIATIWLCLGMVSTGIVQLIQLPEEVQKMKQLGYAPYVMMFIGICKLIGVVVILLPKLPLLKEWAYAGFFFLMSGALFSHLSINDAPSTYFGPSLLLVLTFTSWYTRPTNRNAPFNPTL